MNDFDSDMPPESLEKRVGALSSKQSIFKTGSVTYYITSQLRDGIVVFSSTDFSTHMDVCQGVFRGRLLSADSGSRITGRFGFSLGAKLMLGAASFITLLFFYEAVTKQSATSLFAAIVFVLLLLCGYKLVFMPRVGNHRKAIAAFIVANLNARENGN